MKDYKCTCRKSGNEMPYSDTERQTAEILEVDAQWLHNFMDNLVEAMDHVWDV